MKMPTVLQVLPALETGGVEQTTLDISEALVQKGWTALVASQGGNLVQHLQKIGAQHIQLPLCSKNPWKMAKNAKILSQIIEDQEVNLVHARSRAPAWSAYWAAKNKRIPFVTTFHGTYNMRGVFKKKYNSIMAKGDVVIANSFFIEGHIKDYYQVLSQRIRTIPRGVDLKKFNPVNVSQREQEDLKKAFGCVEERPILVLPGRLTAWKGQQLFLEALTQLKIKNYYALLVGDDQGRSLYREQLESFIKDRGLSSHVKIVGHRSDMPLVLSIADIVVSTSTDPEAFGRVMIEAFSMGKPVVASAHGGALEIVENGKSGFLYAPHDVHALVNALTKALSLSKKEREKLGAFGQRRVQAEFTKETMCMLTLKAYEDLLYEKNSYY